jgi:hypothetical protein
VRLPNKAYQFLSAVDPPRVVALPSVMNGGSGLDINSNRQKIEITEKQQKN